MKKIIILGAGGNCIDMLDAILCINDDSGTPVYEVIGFLDDNSKIANETFHGYPVLGNLASAKTFSDACFVFGIGSTRNFQSRQSIFSSTTIAPERFETIIHPSAQISRYATIGRGSIILPNTSVGSNATVGQFVLVLPNTVISHDTRVGDFTCIAGGVCISGGVSIGTSSYIGTNSSLISSIKVGNRCLVGMGAVVLRDVDDGIVVAGNPAEYLRNLQS